MISDTNVSAGKESAEEENAAMRAAASLGSVQITEKPTERAVTKPEGVRKPKARSAGRRVVLRILGQELD